jgi:hypothetical protein
MNPRSLAVLSITALLFAVMTSIAASVEPPTRAEYVETLEAICRPDAEATERAVAGVKGDLRTERLSRAAIKFADAARIFGGTIAAVSAVPRPLADRPKLADWFGYLHSEESYLRRIAAALRADQAVRSQHLTARFVHNGNLANRTVLAFGFEYCAFDFARFG